MDLAKPFNAVSPSVDGDVLVALARAGGLQSGRALARSCGRSSTGAQQVLNRLVDLGLVERTEADHVHLYALNREHLLAPAVEQMATARVELVHRLRTAMASWKIQPVHASLFGSAARGDGDERSDIDLLLVRPADTDADESRWRHQLDTLAELVRKWSGNHCALIELGERELPRLRRDRPPVVDEVMADAVDLAGKSARQILRPM